MSELGVLNRVDADNNNAANLGWPEGMPRTDVNNRARELEGALRRWYEDAGWTDLLIEYSNDFTVSRISSTVVNVADNGATDATSKFTVGAYFRISGVDSGSDDIVIATVASIGAYTTSIDVTFENIRNASTFAAASLPDTSVATLEAHVSTIMREAGIHPVGTTLAQTPTQIPDIDSLGTHVTKAEGADGGIDADLLDGQHGAFYSDLILSAVPNDLINGDMSVWQRGTTIDGGTAFNNNDGNYCADRWALLSEANDRFDASRVELTAPATDLLPGSRYYMRLTAVNTTASPNAEKGGILQILEENDSFLYTQAAVASMSFWARTNAGSSMTSIRYAILEHDGAITPTSDPVTAWNGGGVAPTLGANWSYAGTGSTTDPLVQGTFTLYTLENIAISSTARHICVMILVDEDTYQATDELDIGAVMLNARSQVGAFSPEHLHEQIAACQRFFCKSFDYDTTPADNAGALGALHAASVNSSAQPELLTFDWRYTAEMRIAPTIATYNPSAGTAAFAEDINGATDRAVIADSIGTNGALIRANTALSNNTAYRVHVTADAEF